ncbi:26S proteasome non-ATPase regulatory subunit 8 homolog A-like [Argentina anserina]|uniref:26S proteasome non-ATPase regulatory subunit 8 homolog A-like n=1 Tax=Argentina anserina TaxID=57926 RepID=UPI0021762CF9|nr:26S proteasome non-ATPase regulatory subunit 8 homolog A-like [Potentilla anserina]
MASPQPPLQEVHMNFVIFRMSYEQKDYNACSQLLPKLKAMLAQLRSLPPMYEATPNAAGELAVARDIYEHAVVISLKTENEEAFERDFLKLKQYYYAAVGTGSLPPSPQEDMILGLNLLRLLVQNRTEEFHTELEMLACLSPTALDNPCIKDVVELEQSLMEEGGGYISVLEARQTMPDDNSTYTYANYFVDLLQNTITDQGNKKIDAAVFIEKVKESAPCKEIPSLQLINQMLSHATKLDQIDGSVVQR